MNVNKLVAEWSRKLAVVSEVTEVTLIGSAVYADNPKDVDFLVYVAKSKAVPNALAAQRVLPENADFTTPKGEYDDQDATWAAFRHIHHPEVNLIVTVDKGWYDRAALASEVCHALKLQDKGDRIVVFRVVRDGYDAESAQARRNGEA